MKINMRFLVKYKTKGGYYTKDQMAALGLPYPAPKGWQETVLGKELAPDQAKRFRKARGSEEIRKELRERRKRYKMMRYLGLKIIE